MLNFFMSIGIPGSGKSSFGENLRTKGFVIISSDEVRKEIFGTYGANSKEQNTIVFATMEKRVRAAVLKGEDIYYDACNLSAKKRRNLLANIPHHYIKQAFLFATPVEECRRRNALRERKVPDEVITKFFSVFEVPNLDEGFTGISLIRDPNVSLLRISDFLESARDFDQENSHHAFSLGEHCLRAAEFIKLHSNDKVLFQAAQLHDCGKPFCKSFREEDVNAHYYQHHCIGAYQSLFYESDSNEDCLDRAFLIQHHMDWYFMGEEKLKKMYPRYFDRLKLLHEADIGGHGIDIYD